MDTGCYITHYFVISSGVGQKQSPVKKKRQMWPVLEFDMIGVALKFVSDAGAWLNLVLGGLSGDISAIGYVPSTRITLVYVISGPELIPSVRAGPAYDMVGQMKRMRKQALMQ